VSFGGVQTFWNHLLGGSSFKSCRGRKQPLYVCHILAVTEACINVENCSETKAAFCWCMCENGLSSLCTVLPVRLHLCMLHSSRFAVYQSVSNLFFLRNIVFYKTRSRSVSFCKCSVLEPLKFRYLYLFSLYWIDMERFT